MSLNVAPQTSDPHKSKQKQRLINTNKLIKNLRPFNYFCGEDNMEYFPENVLETIFLLTEDVYSIRDLLFVCSRFRNVILDSSLLMQKLPIEFRESKDIFLDTQHAIVQEILKGSSKIQEVTIEGKGCLAQIPVKIHESLKAIRFRKSVNDTVTSVKLCQFRNFINLAVCLEKLLCHELQSIEYEDEQTVLISKQLERLEIIDRQCSFVDENLQAKQLLVVFDNQNEDPKCIANFIGAQKNLKFLELKDLDINKFELKDKFAVLKLEDLSLIGIQTNDDTNASNTNKNEFVQFIKSLSLRSFKMANCSFDEVIYIIMTEMKELKTLRLCADTITHKTFNNLLNVQARSITTLILDQYFSDDIFEATLRSTPDVITLRCSFKLNSSHFKSISENLTKLKYFSLQCLDECIDFSLFGSFPTVKKLVVDAIKFDDHKKGGWKTFAMKFSDVHHLIFKQGPYQEGIWTLDETVMVFLCSMPSMKILEIGGEQVNRDVLLAIARDPHQVKVFKFEGGHGVEDDLSDIFKNTNLLVSFCPASYFQVKYNPYEKRYGSFGSADDWGFDEIDDFDEDESISDDDYNDEFDIV